MVDVSGGIHPSQWFLEDLPFLVSFTDLHRSRPTYVYERNYLAWISRWRHRKCSIVGEWCQGEGDYSDSQGCGWLQFLLKCVIILV